MAYCDYIHCAICDTKAVYDSDVDYEYSNAADMLTLCVDCFKRGYTLSAIDPNGERVDDSKIKYRGFTTLQYTRRMMEAYKEGDNQ